jgi:transcriptional regulator with XRE-family HTH domain
MKKKIVNEKLRRDVGRIIGNIRKSLGMSQIELAKEVGYSHASTISQIESGQMNLYADDLVKIAKALGVSVATLLQLAVEREHLDKEKIVLLQRFTAYLKQDGPHLEAIKRLLDTN